MNYDFLSEYLEDTKKPLNGSNRPLGQVNSLSRVQS